MFLLCLFVLGWWPINSQGCVPLKIRWNTKKELHKQEIQEYGEKKELKEIGCILVWHISFDLSGFGDPSRSLSSRQYSYRGHSWTKVMNGYDIDPTSFLSQSSTDFFVCSVLFFALFCVLPRISVATQQNCHLYRLTLNAHGCRWPAGPITKYLYRLPPETRQAIKHLFVHVLTVFHSNIL